MTISGTATFDGEMTGNNGLIVSTTNRAGLQVVSTTNVGAERGIEFQTSRPSAHGDLAGTISWNSNDGAAAAISAEILGNAGDATVPGRITISTGGDYGNLTERVSISSKETIFTLSDRNQKAFVLQVENSSHPIIDVESDISGGNVVKIETRNFLLNSSEENVMRYRSMHLNGGSLNISSATVFQPSVITMAPNADYHAVHVKQGSIFTSDEKFMISTCNVSCITDTDFISTTTSASVSTTTQTVSTQCRQPILQYNHSICIDFGK